MTALNIGNYARSAYGRYPYSIPLGIDYLGIELIMLGKITQALGIECLLLGYNTDLLRILWEFASDGIDADNFISSSNTFIVSTASADVGAVYSNNGQEFTVTQALVAGTVLYCTGTGASQSSGTLTKVSGSGNATITFSTVYSGNSIDKGVLNLKSDIIEQYWQTSVAEDQWFQFDVGYGHTTLIDTLALIGTNLTTSSVINIYGYGTSTSAAPSDWSTVPLMFRIYPSSDPLEKNIIYIAQTQPIGDFRHFRITISDPTNPDGFIRIGRFVAGMATIFSTENCLSNVSFKTENYKDEFKINGFTSIANNRTMKRQLTLSFENLNRIQYTNYRRLMTYINYCRDTLKALVIIDPKEPYQFTVFSKLKETPSENHNYISSDTSIVELQLVYDEGR